MGEDYQRPFIQRLKPTKTRLYIDCRYIEYRYTKFMRNEDAKGSRTIFLVLLALSNGPMHGYEISKFIESKSNGFFRVPFGSLYPVLHRLETDKLIQAKWETNATQKQKKTYALTVRGKRALKDEVSFFQSLTDAINALCSPEMK